MPTYIVFYRPLENKHYGYIIAAFATKACAERYIIIQQPKLEERGKTGKFEIQEHFPIDGVEKLYYITPTFYEEV